MGHGTAAEAAPGPVQESGGLVSDYWGAYSAGLSFLAGLRDGRPVRAVWTALPGGPPTWPGAVAEAVRQTVAAGRGVVVVVPDGKDVALVGAALQDTPHVTITADLGPAERYRRWLRVLRGEVTVAVGNRATAFAPVRDLGLAVLWDDGDDLHSERLAPYPHAREVLATRVHAAGAAMLIGGYARTAEGTRLIATGWAKPLTAAREEVRRWAPRVRPAGDDAELGRDQAARAARLPSVAWRALKAGLERGPVLVQVPRRGYLPALNCQNCRTRARCTNCSGPLALTNGHAAPYCRWCGRIAGDWRCHNCGSPRLRAAVVGARRTAEELGRAFPSTRVTTSGRDGVLASVPGTAALVVATPGAEPVAEGGYAAAALLDGWAMLSRPDLRAAEEALRRWLNAAALVRPGGEVVVLADGQAPVTQALVRWDPVTHAERELRDRAELGFPPVTHVATLTGSPAAIREMLGIAALPEGVEVLGPVPVGRTGEERAVLRAPKARGAELARVLKGAAGVRSARKAAEVVRVDIDPLDLL
ncbi:primosome assembly protein PriA [Herbidospora sp. NBRC 101105]|uniref:primosome assembly protein PriA n=1 Tax=Herbidospora sp. NBRC 101105 TaxID=3032195 RepID=UPI00255433D7|nr:primosome assembly protein PriA [Herbidospora sp. NBRC 101105]